jgi:hypothetical protein
MRTGLSVCFKVLLLAKSYWTRTSGCVSVTTQTVGVCQMPLDVGMDLALDVEETTPSLAWVRSPVV